MLAGIFRRGGVFQPLNKESLQPGTSVVLLYHRLGTLKLGSLVAGQYVAPRLFASELNYLQARGWKSVPLAETARRCQSGAPAEQDEFCVTFDDGYLSVYEHGCPILSGRNMTAVIYVVADTIGGINEWDKRRGDQEERMMTAKQIREVSDAGFEIASHTLTHPHLPELDDEHLARELTDSKHKLEDIIGREVTSFSYPYGDFDNRVLTAAVAAGYQNAMSTKLGTVMSGTSVFEIPRVNVRWNAIGPLLMRKINRARRASRARM